MWCMQVKSNGNRKQFRMLDCPIIVLRVPTQQQGMMEQLQGMFRLPHSSGRKSIIAIGGNQNESFSEMRQNMPNELVNIVVFL